jgi:hypothetical protein
VARIGLVFQEQDPYYGNEVWQQKNGDHELGIYQVLIESRIPFEMVNSRLLDPDHLNPFKLLILPNMAVLSEKQCGQLRNFTQNGGCLLATFETSLYDESGKKRDDFGLADLFGVSYARHVEGPMQNSYLRLKSNPGSNDFHPVLKDLENAYRTINTIHLVHVKPEKEFVSPVTVIPTYPDLPMEQVFPREPETDTRGLYLTENGNSRVAYFPGDIDRTYWQILCTDHQKLLRNAILWALNEEPVIEVKGPGVMDVTVWKQERSMTAHLVNLTNPMMAKGPFREFIPVDAEIKMKIPAGIKIEGIHLLVSREIPVYKMEENVVSLKVSEIKDHEIIGFDIKHV